MNKLLFFILLLGFIVNINSQIISDFGLKIGVGFSNQSWEYKDDINLDFDDKVGIAPRIFLEFFDFSVFQIQAELGYLQKGFKEQLPVTTPAQPDGTGEFIDLDASLNYLLFSTLAKFKYETESLIPYIVIGPQFNILLSKDTPGGFSVVFDQFSNASIGFSLGAGAELKNVFPFTILVEYKYERDFVDNYDSPNVSVKNYSHLFLIGVNL